MVRREKRGCDRLPPRVSPDSSAEAREADGEYRQCVKGGRRQVWQAPDWASHCRQDGGESKMPCLPSAPQPQVLTQRGVGHNLRVYEVFDARNSVQGSLVGCKLCGAYSHVCRRLLSKRCLGGAAEHCNALRVQLKRLERGRHPQGRKPYTQ
eukprot:4155616-Amphidinium_carterae.1